MWQTIVIVASLFCKSSLGSRYEYQSQPTWCADFRDDSDGGDRSFWFVGELFEKRTMVIHGTINSTDWFVKLNLAVSANRTISDNPNGFSFLGIMIGSDNHNKTRVLHAWRQSSIDIGQNFGRTHPGTYDGKIHDRIELKLYTTNQEFPVITLNGTELQVNDIFYCNNCIITYVHLEIENYRLEKVCYDIDNTVWSGPEYHRLMFDECKKIRQVAPDKSYQFETGKNFNESHEMTFRGTTEGNWSIKVDLLVCPRRNESADDCFSLVFDAFPGRNGKDIDCQVSKKRAESDLLETTNHTFYNGIAGSELSIEVFNLNDVLRIVFNKLEIRLSKLTYCVNCSIQFVNLQVGGYRLKEACFKPKNGNLRLPWTTIEKVGQHAYKNTETSIKDVILENLKPGLQEVRYVGSVINPNWKFDINLMYKGSTEQSKLIFRIAAANNGTTIQSSLLFMTKKGTERLGAIATFNAERTDEVADIEVRVLVQCRGLDNEKSYYEFFVNGRKSNQSYTGPAFGRLKVYTKHASVEHVSFLSKS